MNGILAPLLIGLAAVVALLVVASGVTGTQRFVERVRVRRNRRPAERLQESRITSLEWAFSVRREQVAPPTSADTTTLEPSEIPEVSTEPSEPALRTRDHGDDARAALKDAQRQASEILVAAADRRAVELEENARRNAEAWLAEAQREAGEILAAAERSAIELEESAQRSAEATLADAQRQAGEILAAAERRAIELEESAQRSAEAKLAEAQRQAGEVVAAAEPRAAELEESARRSVAETLEKAQRRAREIVAAAKPRAAELEETARRSAEAALAEAQRQAGQIVAQAERVRVRFEDDLLREQAQLEDTRTRLSALLQTVLAEVKDQFAEEVSNVRDLHEARDLRSKSASAEQ